MQALRVDEYHCIDTKSLHLSKKQIANQPNETDRDGTLTGQSKSLATQEAKSVAGSSDRCGFLYKDPRESDGDSRPISHMVPPPKRRP